jgi:phospholipid/cholesterol/gamma-HCH transport system substrate-binding protein
VQVTDGKGPPIPSGTTLPASATKGESSLNDVLNSLKPPTRRAAARLILALRASTAGRGHNLNQLMASLGTLGRQGQTVFSVLANQNQDLSRLVRQTGTLMGVLDEGQGQIADLSSAAEQVTRAATGSSAALRHTMEDLPPLVATARSATASVRTLSGSLAPIATNLRAAAPNLNYDLVHLRPETARLRGLLPALNGALAEAPATLGPLPTTAADLTRALPPSADLLSQANPVLSYLVPYDRDLGAFFANFAAATGHTMPGYPGYFGVVIPIPNRSGAQGVPGDNPGNPQLPFGGAAGGNVVTNNNNPYPAPGFSNSPPTPFSGRYHRVRPEPYGAG